MFLKVIIFFSITISTIGSPVVRVVNGSDAWPGEFPEIVSLRVADTHSCGGSILNERYILTAAHCVQYPVSYFSVQYGLTHIDMSPNASNVIKVSKLIPHEEYTPGNGYINDIAIVELEESLSFNRYVQPVKLPEALQPTPAFSPALLAGWGNTHVGGFGTYDLQKVSIFVYPDNECERIHKETGPTNKTFHICAGVPQGGKGQCGGDSGGPLIVNHVQVGIVSWSVKPCTVKGYPGVFTKVSSYIDWINNKLDYI